MRPPVDPVDVLPIWRFGDSGFVVYLGTCNDVLNPICLINEGDISVVTDIGLTAVWRYDDVTKNLVTTSDFVREGFGNNMRFLLDNRLHVADHVEYDSLDVSSLSYKVVG